MVLKGHRSKWCLSIKAAPLAKLPLQAVSSHSGGWQLPNWQLNCGTFLLKSTAKTCSPQEGRKKKFSPRNRKQPAPPVLKSTKLEQPKVWSRSHQPPSEEREGAPAYERRPSPPVVAAPSQAVLESCSIQPKRIQKIFHQDSVGRFTKHQSWNPSVLALNF